MILAVTFAKTTYNALPNKFEAGTPNISGAIGLGAAVDFLSGLDRDAATLTRRPAPPRHAVLTKIPGLRIIGTAADKASLVSFVVAGVHPHDLGTILDEDGIRFAPAIIAQCRSWISSNCRPPRALHCLLQPLEEIDRLGAGIERARKMFV